MAKRLTRFQKRQLDRKEQVTRWEVARDWFRRALEAEDVNLDDPFHDLIATSSWDAAEWYAFWDRKEIQERDDAVIRRIERRAFAADSLQGGPAPHPGEERTGRMWDEAFNVGPEAFDAALILTAIRSANWENKPLTPWPEKSLMDQLSEGAYYVLKAANVRTYTMSTVWFLPRSIPIKGDFADLSELAAALGKGLGTFLRQWAPVRIAITHKLPK